MHELFSEAAVFSLDYSIGTLYLPHPKTELGQKPKLQSDQQSRMAVVYKKSESPPKKMWHFGRFWAKKPPFDQKIFRPKNATSLYHRHASVYGVSATEGARWRGDSRSLVYSTTDLPSSTEQYWGRQHRMSTATAISTLKLSSNSYKKQQPVTKKQQPAVFLWTTSGGFCCRSACCCWKKGVCYSGWRTLAPPLFRRSGMWQPPTVTGSTTPVTGSTATCINRQYRHYLKIH